jgi:hypothetical protein
MSSAPFRFFMAPTQMDNVFVPTTWNSLFIPAVPFGVLDVDYLTWVFEELLQLGKVKRVDIVTKNKEKNQHMAFVHFDYWNDAEQVHHLRHLIETQNSVDVCGGNGNQLIHMRHPNLFLRLMVNKTPIKETEMNIHQVAANLEMMEATIADQRDTINSVLKELADAKSRIEELEMLVESNKENVAPVLTPIKTDVAWQNFPSPPKLQRQPKMNPYFSENQDTDSTNHVVKNLYETFSQS